MYKLVKLWASKGYREVVFDKHWEKIVSIVYNVRPNSEQDSKKDQSSCKIEVHMNSLFTPAAWVIHTGGEPCVPEKAGQKVE